MVKLSIAKGSEKIELMGNGQYNLDNITNSQLSNISTNITFAQGSTYDIGTAEKKVRSIYADEVHISQNTLYIGDTPVIGTQQDTINIKADTDQSLLVKTTGEGYTQINSERGINSTVSGINGTINFTASGKNSAINFGADKNINLSAENIHLDGVTTIQSLNVVGTTTTVNSTNLSIKDNLIEINKGETGNGVTAGTAGLKIDRGDATDYLIQFDESDDKLKVGFSGDLKTVATTDDVNALSDNINTALAGKSSTSHTHDDRYYTETEVNTLLSGKAASSHTHSQYLTAHATVDSALSSTSTNAIQNKVVNAALAGKATSSHTHSKADITDFPSSLPANGGTSAACSGNAATATKASTLAAGNSAMTFNWSSKTGQPTYLWGGDAVANMYVYNPSNFSVSYATTAGTANAAYYSDYAEFFPRGEKTEVGDIIALDETVDAEQYIKATENSKCVVGVHSEEYGIIVGGEEPDTQAVTRENYFKHNIQKYIPVGLAGRVPVKFKGIARKGEKVVPSNEPGIGRLYIPGTDNLENVIGYLVEADNKTDVRLLRIKLK